jgi:hypothetical protein
MPRVKGADGKWTRSPDTAARDAEACRLRTRAVSYSEIARQLGFSNSAAAHEAVQRGLREIVAEPAEQVRQFEIERLDGLWDMALAIAERHHVTVSNGRVVYLGDMPLSDDGPALQAMDRLLKIQERRARLLGLDAPVKHEVRNVDALDAEIERLVAQLAARSETAPAPEVAPGAGARPVPQPG